MNLFSNINEKVQEKISTGALNEDMLSGEAQNLYGNFQNKSKYVLYLLDIVNNASTYNCL